MKKCLANKKKKGGGGGGKEYLFSNNMISDIKCGIHRQRRNVPRLRHERPERNRNRNRRQHRLRIVAGEIHPLRQNPTFFLRLPIVPAIFAAASAVVSLSALHGRLGMVTGVLESVTAEEMALGSGGRELRARKI